MFPQSKQSIHMSFISADDLNDLKPNMLTPGSILFGKKKPQDEKLICHEQFKFVNGTSWLMKFKIQKLNPSKRTSLRMFFSENNCKRQGIELTFMDVEQIILNHVGRKSNFQVSPILTNLNSTTQSFENETIWIVYDNNVLRVGHGEEIRLSSQLVDIKVDHLQSNLSYFSFEYQQSYNLEIYDLEIIAVIEKLRHTLAVMNNIPTFNGANVSYTETYTRGSFCAPAKRGRITDIEYRCSANGEFFTIESISETGTCHYHVVVGTSLLCSKKESISKFQASASINCLVLN